MATTQQPLPAEGQTPKAMPAVPAVKAAPEVQMPQAPEPDGQQSEEAAAGPAGYEATAQRALVPTTKPAEDEAEEEADIFPPGAPEGQLPVEVDVVLPVREFRVRHLLALEPGQVIASEWTHGDAVPLTAGDVQLAWSEFEVIDEQLAVRVTRLP